MHRFLIKNELKRCYQSLLLNARYTFQVPFIRYKSHYTSLGLDSSASSKDIKSAYYKLSLKHHPDKNDGSSESVEKFRQIAEAYEVLGNPEKKKVYDRDFHTKSDYDSPRDGYDPRSGYYYRTPPRTGRDKYYNYEEHIRQHYEKFYREREEEQENMRRYYNRYYQDKQYYRASQQPPRQSPRMALKELITSSTFRAILVLWSTLIIMSIFTDGDKINKDSKPIYYSVPKNHVPKPLYYDTKKHDDGKE